MQFASRQSFGDYSRNLTPPLSSLTQFFLLAIRLSDLMNSLPSTSMNTLRQSQLRTSSARKHGRWGLFILLTAVFFMAQPYNLHSSIDYTNHFETNDYVDVGQEVDDLSGHGQLSRQIAISILFAFAVIYISSHRSRRWALPRSLAVLIMLFLIWAVASITWSDDVFLTTKRVIVLAALTMGAFVVEDALSGRDLVVLAFANGVFTLALGFVCEISLGTFRPFMPGYRFGGELNPIYQAYSCGMLSLSAMALAQEGGRKRGVYLLTALLALACMVMTRSRGPLTAVLIASVAVFIMIFSRMGKIRCASIVCTACLLLLFLLGTSAVNEVSKVALLGRNDEAPSELTGRIPLWRACYAFAERRLITGYGYDSFWTSDRFRAVITQSDFRVPDTHNGYLDVLLGLGIPGLGLFVGILTVGTVRAWARNKRYRSPENALTLSMLLFLAVNMALLSPQLKPMFPSFVVMTLLVRLARGEKAQCVNLGSVPLPQSALYPTSR